MQNQPVIGFNSEQITYGPPQPPPAGYYPPPHQQSPYNAAPNYEPITTGQWVNNQKNDQPPVFQQPQINASQFNSGPTGDIPGLQGLLDTDRLVVKQKKEMLEIFTLWEANNKYEIYNGHGQQIYYAVEDTDGLTMCFLSEIRPFCIRILDPRGQQVMVVNANVDCCTREVTVELPPGRRFAQIKQEFACMTRSFLVTDLSTGQLIFQAKSPMAAAFGSFGSTNFDILSGNQQSVVVGQISKEWGGFFKEAFTNADTFGLSVPADMSSVWKAVLLALTFFIDFEFYEKSNR